MKFYEYLESNYVTSNIENQKQYSPSLQARTHAVQDLINWQRKFFKFTQYFKLIFGYFLVKLGFSPEPKSPKEITEELKSIAKMEQEKAKRELVSGQSFTTTADTPLIS